MYVGYTCAYTPLIMIDAAGLTPYRILPLSDAEERAGEMLHDNLCPHVKRVLDRALDDDLPELAGVVFVNSCDAMRRLADAWKRAKPDIPMEVVDLPVSKGAPAVRYLSAELDRLAGTLERWSGRPLEPAALDASEETWNKVAKQFRSLQQRCAGGVLPGGSAALQMQYDLAAGQGLSQTRDKLDALLSTDTGEAVSPSGVPVFVFGNVLPDPEVFTLFESCGARVVGDDLCTGSRLIQPLEPEAGATPLQRIARGILQRSPCARAVDADTPHALALHIAKQAQNSGARGVIGHVLKFCDPYLARLPSIRDALRDLGLGLLVLEGDCTLRSLGQQRTRIEAFVETLES